MGVEQALVTQEQNVLASCLKNREYILDVDKKYFVSDEAEVLFTDLKNLALSEHFQDRKITARDLFAEVNKRGYDITLSLIDTLYKLDIEIDEKSFERYYKELKILWFQFEVSEKTFKSVLEETNKTTSFDINKVKDTISNINACIEEVEEECSDVYNLNRLFDFYCEELENRNSRQPYGTGCGHLDRELTEGFAPGYITTIFGSSGVGKSAYGLYLVNKQINKMIPNLYFSLEMGPISNMDRLCAQRLGIDYKYFYPDYHNDKPIPDHIVNMVREEAEKLKNYKHFYYFDLSSPTLSEIESHIMKYKSKMNVDNLVVTIDLLTMIYDFNKNTGNSQASVYEKAMNEVHFIAKRTNSHIVGVVQARRPQEKVRIRSVDQLIRFRPGKEELKNSGSMEERSRIILGIFRPKHFANVYLPDSPETQILTDTMEVSVLKQNMGALNRIEYLFDPNRYKLTPYERPEEDLYQREEE